MALQIIILFILFFSAFIRARRLWLISLLCVISHNFGFSTEAINLGNVSVNSYNVLPLILMIQLLLGTIVYGVKKMAYVPFKGFLIWVLFLYVFGLIYSSHDYIEGLIFNLRFLNIILIPLTYITFFNKKIDKIDIKIFLSIAAICFGIYLIDYLLGTNVYGTTDFLLGKGRKTNIFTFYFVWIFYLFNSNRTLTSLFSSLIYILGSGTRSILIGLGAIFFDIRFNKRKILKNFIFIGFLILLLFSVIYAESIPLFLSSYDSSGTMVLRSLITLERLEFWLSDFKVFLFGVGFFSEMSVTDIIFTYGTPNEILPLGYEQFSTADILYPNLFLRYGLIGSFLFGKGFYILYKYSSRNNTYFGRSLKNYLALLLVISFAGSQLLSFEKLGFLFIYMSSNE